jgi:hypothetical protein
MLLTAWAPVTEFPVIVDTSRLGNPHWVAAPHTTNRAGWRLRPNWAVWASRSLLPRGRSPPLPPQAGALSAAGHEGAFVQPLFFLDQVPWDLLRELNSGSFNFSDRRANVQGAPWFIPWLRQLVAGLSPQRPGFLIESVYVDFVVDKVALGQVILRIFLFYPVNIIPPWLYTLIYQLEMNKRSIGGRSSERESHPIDMDNINRVHYLKCNWTRVTYDGTKIKL